ncbi:hypothetical protein [Streptomyces hydrogenans]|uniref:hypothetical protein n=1 Tax=Streptomyces hydrogenans TaxID=1873719 RepID=UPI0035E07067
MDSQDEQPPVTPVPRKPARWRRNQVIAVLVGVAIGAGALGAAWALTGTERASSESDRLSITPSSATSSESPSPTLTTFLLTGTLLLTSGVVSDGTGGCEGSNGFDDITEGAAVTVYDASGTVVATGELGESTRQGGACSFDVLVPDVPTGEGFYQVEVTHRGTIQLSEEEAMSGSFGGSLG